MDDFSTTTISVFGKKILYLFAPDVLGRSKLILGVEKHLGAMITTRNLRTLQKALESVRSQFRFTIKRASVHRVKETMNIDQPSKSTTTRLARWVFASFLITFVVARILVLLIMTRRMPDLFLHVGGTHVHHLNYGIFLLAGVGAYLIFVRPNDVSLRKVAVLYGIGLALTFDEFGMWLHLGGAYWQRASFDAIVVIGSLLGLVAFAPSVVRFRTRQWLITTVIVASLIVFCLLTSRSITNEESILRDKIRSIESQSPP